MQKKKIKNFTFDVFFNCLKNNTSYQIPGSKEFSFANNLLAILGIPNLTDFERRMSDPKELERFANNPKFSEMVNSSTSESDLAKIEGRDKSQEDDGGMFGGTMGMGMLKLLAQRYV